MPSTPTDRLNGLTTSVAVKAPCRTVSTANITLAGLQTINGVLLAEDDRVLVKDQTAASENGIYNASTGDWTRSKDFDGNRDVVRGTLVVSNTSTGIYYRVTSEDPIVIGTSDIDFEIVSGAITQSSLGLALYPLSAAEIAAGLDADDIVQPWRDYGDVRRYGALGNYPTDDGPAIQKAINAAGNNHAVVLAPGATHGVATPIVITKRVTIKGHGRGVSALAWNGGAGVMLTASTDGDTDVVTIEDIGLDNAGSASVLLQLNTIHAVLNRLWCVPGIEVTDSIIKTNTAETVYNLSIRDSFFSSFSADHASPRAVDVARGHTARIDGCMFSGFTQSCVRGGISGGAAIGSLSIVNTRFEQFSGTPGTGYPGGNSVICLDAINVDCLTVHGCSFELAGDSDPASSAQRAIVLTNVNGGSIRGNYISGNGQCVSGMTIANVGCQKVAIDGNQFYNFSSDGIEQISSGKLIDQQIGANFAGGATPRIYDNTFTPALTFGGGSTGLTYTAQVGRWSRYNDEVNFEIIIVLSAKGSSTGAVRVTGLPITSLSTSAYQPSASVMAAVLSSITGSLQALVRNADTKLQLFYLGTGSITELTEANFNNTSELHITGRYRV